MERVEGFVAIIVGTRSVVPTTAAKTNLMENVVHASLGDVSAVVDHCM